MAPELDGNKRGKGNRHGGGKKRRGGRTCSPETLRHLGDYLMLQGMKLVVRGYLLSCEGRKTITPAVEPSSIQRWEKWQKDVETKDIGPTIDSSPPPPPPDGESLHIDIGGDWKLIHSGKTE